MVVAWKGVYWQAPKMVLRIIVTVWLFCFLVVGLQAAIKDRSITAMFNEMAFFVIGSIGVLLIVGIFVAAINFICYNCLFQL